MSERIDPKFMTQANAILAEQGACDDTRLIRHELALMTARIRTLQARQQGFFETHPMSRQQYEIPAAKFDDAANALDALAKNYMEIDPS